MFDSLAPKVSSQGLARWLPEAVGLATAGCVAWLTCPRPESISLTLPGMTALAIRYVLLCTLAGLAGSLATAAILARTGPLGALLISCIRLSAAMVWAPPLALFLSHRSVWAGVASAAAAWYTAKQLVRPVTDRDAVGIAAVFRTFCAMDSLARVPSPQALGAAACAEFGVTMAVVGNAIASAMTFGIGSSLLAWSANKFRLIPETGVDTSRSTNRLAWLFACSILFTLAGFLQGVLGSGGDQQTRRGSAGQSQHRRKNASGFAAGIGGDYTGVILLADASPHPLFVVPRPSLKPPLANDQRDNPASVPFSGVYWMFRWPNSQPPPNSYVARRSPLNAGFRTSDGAPLSMQAHQNFGRPIELKCCSAIELAIKSADEFTTLGLILTNTTLPGSPWLFLGQREVNSKPGRQTAGPASPREMVVSFDVPPNPAIREFDEATIVFNQSFARASAKVEIERFIFVPRR